MWTDTLLPIHLAPGNHGIYLMDRGEETSAPHSDSELQLPHHAPHHPSGLALVAHGSQIATGDADTRERYERTRITQSDWNIHRETIVYLYRDCMQPLNRVRETMEREYGFFATERMYKHRFKQWRIFKYAKQGSSGQPRRGADNKVTEPQPSEAIVRWSKNTYPTRIATPLVLPDGLRDLEVCMSHLHSFILATCGDSRKRPRTVDPSPDMTLNRSLWLFTVNNAVLQIHQGRLTTGFKLLDTVFSDFRQNINAQDTAFLARLVSCLCLFADHGLPGLAAIFLQYAYHTLCLELSPVHPFSIVTRKIQAAVFKDGRMDAAWDLLARYSELLWESSDPSPTAPLPPEPIPGVTRLSWDLVRGVDRDFISPLAAPSESLGWASQVSVSVSVAHLHMSQRFYRSARRVIEDMLAHLDPALYPLDVAIGYRKRWQISHAEGRHARTCADAYTYVEFCRNSLGLDHYMTARAIHDCRDYLGEWRAAYPLDTATEADLLADITVLPPEPEE